MDEGGERDMTYAKLIEGELIFAPNPILHAGLWYGNPPGEVYEAEGYKPVVYTEQPSETPDGYYWSEIWTEEDGNIQQGWVLVEKIDADPAEAIDYLFGGDSE